MAEMIDTDKYTLTKSEFKFTEEGRHLLISQEGGIKFAILGYMIVENPKWQAMENIQGILNYYKNIMDKEECSFSDAVFNDKDNTFVMKGVNYKTCGSEMVTYINSEQYKEAKENFTEHLFGTYYVPTNEFMVKKNPDGTAIPYGLYRFNFDKTYLSCKIDTDLSFSHIILIGKQYAETSDATFNINKRQKGSIVGIASFSGSIDNELGIFHGGIQILKDQNKYVSFQGQLRFTIKEEDENLNKEDDPIVEIPSAVSGTAEKLFLINNGVKTLSGGIAIGYDKEVLDELELDQHGAIAIDKSLVVADCIDADDAENQFNGTALFHGINKYPEDGGEYTPQYLLTSIRATSALHEDITAYCAGMQLMAGGKEEYYINQNAEKGIDSPIFKLSHLPENDYTVVDIFGRDNKNNMLNSDRYLFSYDNSATQPAFNEPNRLINSNGNSFIYGTSNNNNDLYNANYNSFSGNANNNVLFYSKYNRVSDGLNETLLIASDDNEVKNGAQNILFDSNTNTLQENTILNTLYSSVKNTLNKNVTNNVLIRSNDNTLTDDVYDNTIVDSKYNTLAGTAHYSYINHSDRNILSYDTKNLYMLNSTDNKAIGSYDDSIYNSKRSDLRKSSFNSIYDSRDFIAYSADNNLSMQTQFIKVKGLALSSINTNERPIANDTMSNNNILLGSKYFTLFSSSDNKIIGTYGLRSEDIVTNSGPVRIKGTTIINSNGSKLYNAREVYLFNSDYTRVNGTSTYSDEKLGLHGSSFEMSKNNAAELDSIYYGEFYTSYYSIYGLKGSSYKAGAESLNTNCRPSDMLKLRTQFINSYGSELNLSEWIPTQHINTSYVYNGFTSFDNQNRTGMPDSIKPTNSTIIGGHHNKIIGGENVTFLGAEYCKASSKAHQVLMGKFNKDVPADLIFGCGHFNGDTFTQGGKEYSTEELKTIETMAGTIANVRGDSNNKSGATCFNAMEFYAHQGKMILRNCNDGYDTKSNKDGSFGKTVTIDPTGIVFRDQDGLETGLISPENTKTQRLTTIIIDCNNDKYYIKNILNPNAALNTYYQQVGGEVLFNKLFTDITDVQKTLTPLGFHKTGHISSTKKNGTTVDRYAEENSVIYSYPENYYEKIVMEDIERINGLLYDSDPITELTFLFENVRAFNGNDYNKKNEEQTISNKTFSQDCFPASCLICNVIPSFTKEGYAPRFIPSQSNKVKVNILIQKNSSGTNDKNNNFPSPKQKCISILLNKKPLNNNVCPNFKTYHTDTYRIIGAKGWCNNYFENLAYSYTTNAIGLVEIIHNNVSINNMYAEDSITTK